MTSEEKDINLELKKDLIVSDYRMYFDAATRSLDRITTLRQWEITLLVAVFSFALSQGRIGSFAYVMLAILIQFAVLESAIRGGLKLTYQGVNEVERLFLTTSDSSSIIENYVFGNTKRATITFRQKVKAMLQSMVHPDFLVWNLSLVVVFIVLFILL